jgi:nitrite reductase/ring-hydroxylating ferredoxin subunit
MEWKGWYQIAFERELSSELTPARVGDLPLVIVRSGDTLRVFDAVCPHRGAHLAYGGRLDGDAIICPFHGERIALSESTEERFCMREHRVLVVGGLVFVLISDGFDAGFAAMMTDLDATHYVVPGFTMEVGAPADLVIENGFDNTHFRSVHGILNEPEFSVRNGDAGELVVEGEFEIPTSPWQKGATGTRLRVPFTGRAFSPGVFVSGLGGSHPYAVITTATPLTDTSSTVRLSIAVPATADGGAPNQDLCRYLLHQSKGGIEKDRVIWEHLCTRSVSRYTDRDTAVVEFRKFCRSYFKEAIHG